jgi:hypothetical protein
VDESGTHSDQWLVIGMLFVPGHGPLHAALCDVKNRHSYLNVSPKHRGRYKETHFQQFRSPRDVAVGKDWIDLFIQHNCYYRCIVVDWSIWNGKYFGNAFEAEALKKRRAYKKWAEMLLHPELKDPCGGRAIVKSCGWPAGSGGVGLFHPIDKPYPGNHFRQQRRSVQQPPRR